MPKLKKTVSKSKSQERRKAALKNDNQVEARPIGQGKDPLAEGNTLENPSNTEAETHYQVKERSGDVQKASEIAGQNANERAEQHNAGAAGLSQPHDAPNSDTDEQDAVAEGRVEPDGPDANIDDTPEVTPEDNRTEEEIAEGNAEREKALAKDRKTFS